MATTEITTNTTPARGLALATFDDAFRFAKLVASSDFAPKDFRGKPESCLLAIQHGAELGLSPMQALQSIAVVNGRPSVYGDTALAVCRGSAVCEWVRERIEGDGDQMVAICEAKRRGDTEPVISRFSMADAKRAGLAGKSGPWSQYPRRMLQMRARGFCLRDAFPDILRGVITAEEAQDYPTPEPTVAATPRPPVEVRPKFDTATPSPLMEDPAAKARLAINRAKSLEECDKLRRLIEQRTTDGVFTQEQHDELVGLLHGKAELLIGDNGQEFTHEAAEHEVTA